MTIYFSSDLHFGHKNILTYTKRGEVWSSVEDMNEGIVQNINSVVKPEDTLYLLGDTLFCKKRDLAEFAAKTIGRLNGHKFLIRGNHDYFTHKEEFSKYFHWIRDYSELKVNDTDANNGKTQKIVMCHFPLLVWNDGAHGAFHCHGHSHSSLDELNRTTTRLDVGIDAEFSNYLPLSYEQIKEIMKKKSYKPMDSHGQRRNESL